MFLGSAHSLQQADRHGHMRECVSVSVSVRVCVCVCSMNAFVHKHTHTLSLPLSPACDEHGDQTRRHMLVEGKVGLSITHKLACHCGKDTHTHANTHTHKHKSDSNNRKKKKKRQGGQGCVRLCCMILLKDALKAWQKAQQRGYRVLPSE